MEFRYSLYPGRKRTDRERQRDRGTERERNTHTHELTHVRALGGGRVSFSSISGFCLLVVRKVFIFVRIFVLLSF